MQKTSIKTMGILTSGGDAPGLNAAIRAVTRTAIVEYGIKVIGFEHGYRGLIENQYKELQSPDISGILTRGGTILGTSREKPFKDPVIDEKTGKTDIQKMKENYQNLNLDVLIVIGGNGTNTTASFFADEGMNVIALPKTIDNDLVLTDTTIGFHTALTVATEAIDRLHTTAHSHNRIMIIEVMGHKAGWLGLYAGTAGGGDVILIPEIPYDINEIAKHLKQRQKEGKDFSIVVVAEGAKSKEEALLSKKDFKKQRSEMTYSIGYRVAKELEEATGLESRVTVLGYLQRGGIPVPYDRVIATMLGSSAVHMAIEKKFNIMVALQHGVAVGIPLKEIARKIKSVSLDNPVLLSARQVGTCFGDKNDY